MLDMVRDLLAHKADADRMMLNAIEQNATAAGDTRILDLLHHALLANRFWLQTAMHRPCVLAEEARPFASLEDAIHRYSLNQQQENAWLEGAVAR